MKQTARSAVSTSALNTPPSGDPHHRLAAEGVRMSLRRTSPRPRRAATKTAVGGQNGVPPHAPALPVATASSSAVPPSRPPTKTLTKAMSASSASTRLQPEAGASRLSGRRTSSSYLPPGVNRFTMTDHSGTAYVIDVADWVDREKAAILRRPGGLCPMTVYQRSPLTTPTSSGASPASGTSSPLSRSVRRRAADFNRPQATIPGGGGIGNRLRRRTCSASLARTAFYDDRATTADVGVSAAGERRATVQGAAERLRYILHQLNRGELPLEDLKRNIEYAALVLETAYMDETRRICDEDDDLAEVTPEAVPDEVREWLAATFTRQAAANRVKPKFKSVANAIRTGIFFEKLFKRAHTVLAPIPMDLQPILQKSSEWDFDPFFLNEASQGHALKYIGFELFNKHGFLDRFRIPHQHLEKYLLALEAGYSKHGNPYHNIIHATDVTQTTHFMLSQTGLANCLTDLELLAVIFSALIHDYEHTGHTNNFHVQSGSEYAMLYNDRSVLENHHVSSCFRLMKDPEMNLLAVLTKEEYREFRNMVIEIILATDMSTHFVQLKTMKNMLSLPEGIDKTKSLCLIVHACDISHPSKPFYLHEKWTDNVLEEFFRQGDLEKSLGLPYSPLCDRASTHVSESQIGFIDFIVEPTLVVCGEMLTKMVEPLVAMPANDMLSASGGAEGTTDSRDNSSVASPLASGDRRNSSPSSTIRKLPISESGKLEIPNPWLKNLHDNKAEWKTRAIADEAERKKKAAAAAAVVENGVKS